MLSLDKIFENDLQVQVIVESFHRYTIHVYVLFSSWKK